MSAMKRTGPLVAWTMKRSSSWVSLLTVVAFSAVACARNGRPMGQDGSAELGGRKWLEELGAWDAERMKRLRKKDGWLCLAGLYWLGRGENTLGSGEKNDVRLPGPSPARLGTLEVGDDLDHAVFTPSVGVGVEVGGTAVVGPARVATDHSTEPDKVEFERWAFTVIVRGGRHALRLFDRNCPLRERLRQIERFEPDVKYRVIGRWVPFEAPKELVVRSVVDTTERVKVSGRVEFELGGERLSLVPMGDEEGGVLFFVFADRTNGRETYGGGRFLLAEKQGDTVVLDFNRAYNPPCAFTTWATCPVPRPENRLPVEIRAGEKAVHLHDH